jgi:hypothetical protein
MLSLYVMVVLFDSLSIGNRVLAQSQIKEKILFDEKLHEYVESRVGTGYSGLFCTLNR